MLDGLRCFGIVDKDRDIIRIEPRPIENRQQVVYLRKIEAHRSGKLDQFVPADIDDVAFFQIPNIRIGQA